MLAVDWKSGIGNGTGPEREAIMVLGGQDDVLGSRGPENFGPGVGIPLFDFCVKGGSEIVVVVIGPVRFAMIFLRWRAVNSHGVEIPFGVGIVEDIVLGREIVGGMDERSPTGEGVESPMNEDAEFGVAVPGWKRVAIKRFDYGLVGCGLLRAGRDGKKQNKKRQDSETSNNG